LNDLNITPFSSNELDSMDILTEPKDFVPVGCINSTPHPTEYCNADSVTNITFSADHKDINDTISVPHAKKRKAYVLKDRATSWVWKHFKKSDMKLHYAFCILCNKEVFYSKHYSTSMLVRHIKTHHKGVYSDYLDSVADKKVSSITQQGCSTGTPKEV
jgi:hypothetical protein